MIEVKRVEGSMLQCNAKPFCKTKMVENFEYISLILIYVHLVFNFLMTFCDRASLAQERGPYMHPCVRTF